MSIDILRNPPLPPAIKQAYEDERLAIFIGAGVSRLVGCDGWDTLAKNLVKRCYKEKLINFKEKETLLSVSDHKKLITICSHIFKDDKKDKLFYLELGKALKYRHKINSPNIYDDIFQFGGPFLTTNADTHFDAPFLGNVYYKVNDFIHDNVTPRALFHIHGSIVNKEHLIFRVSDYFELYNNRLFQTFLNGIFSQYTVLFLGYGLTDFEVLDYILKNRKGNHFILSGYFGGEENLFKYEQKYYNDMNVHVIAYKKDKKGYAQLSDVVKEWTDEIKQVTNYLSKGIQEIDEAVL